MGNMDNFVLNGVLFGVMFAIAFAIMWRLKRGKANNGDG
jgi:hypothetical protein